MPTVELPFGIILDLSFWVGLLDLPTFEIIKIVFAIIGWVVVVWVMFFVAADMWVGYRQGMNTSKWEWILLAVDVPPDTIQSPKAVEQIFAHLSGALSEPNIGEKYWEGAKQRWFSLEIISLEGYIQFLIFTEITYRDLVEAAVYAQYPMAEITEVEDYVGAIPSSYPNETHNIFGLEFGLSAADPYPIRTYSEFEHAVTPDFTFNDPMAAILENFTHIGAGENLWFQIIIEPISGAWKAKGIELIKKIIGGKAKSAPKKKFMFGIVDEIANELMKQINPKSAGEGSVKKKEEAPGKLSDLTPGVKDTVVAIEEKISKIGFKTKCRMLYAAPNEVFNPSRCVDGFIGSLNQFDFHGRNAIVPTLSTSAHYAFAKSRTATAKKTFLTAYKKRKLKVGKNPYVLNIQELATLWHFPLPLVKTPLLQKTASKRAEPPINLPIEIATESPLRKKSREAPPEADTEEEEKEEGGNGKPPTEQSYS